jgi:TM2 domain-containing membrane protein YozV
MALIECNECGRQVSDKAASCPGCGAPISAAVVAPNAATVQQVQIVNQPKSRGTYIILALFFGAIGIHNFYANQNAVGAAKIGLFFVTLIVDASTGFYSGFFMIALVVNAIWALVEAISTKVDGNGTQMA